MERFHSWNAGGADVPDGEITSFPAAVKCREDETVCHSLAVWPFRTVCDDAMPKIMEETRRHIDANPMPFDRKHMIRGGFEMIVDV